MHYLTDSARLPTRVRSLLFSRRDADGRPNSAPGLGQGSACLFKLFCHHRLASCSQNLIWRRVWAGRGRRISHRSRLTSARCNDARADHFGHAAKAPTGPNSRESARRVGRWPRVALHPALGARGHCLGLVQKSHQRRMLIAPSQAREWARKLALNTTIVTRSMFS